MAKVVASAERGIDAPGDVVCGYLADMKRALRRLYLDELDRLSTYAAQRHAA